MADLLITGCSEIVTVAGEAPRRGKALGEIGILRDAAVLVREERITAIGPRNHIEKLSAARRGGKLDLGGRVLLPGFVDSHTHLIFPTSRAAEYEERIRGKTYEQIARAGGGILSTVRALRETTGGELRERALKWLDVFAAHGTTTVEAKSGYGLNLESEQKILRVQKAVSQEHPLGLISTFMGAHAVPQEFRGRADAFVNEIAQSWLPQVATEGLAEFCDVFCDKGAFTPEQARKVLTAGRACGLTPRIHAEQIARTGAAQLAVQLHAASADHLEKINKSDISALGKSDVTCTLLPGCSFHLGLGAYAPARALIAAGAIVALATDFNPGTCPTPSMPMILSIACSQMRMTPAEAIAAATINAAFSLGRHKRVGSIEVGKYADLVAFDVADHREIPYYFGLNRCWATVKRGRIIYQREK